MECGNVHCVDAGMNGMKNVSMCVAYGCISAVVDAAIHCR